MTEVGAISFRAVIDTSSIRGEIARLNQALSNERALIRVAFDTSTIRAEMARINAAIARESTQIKIGVQIDRQALAAAQRQIQQITQGAQQGGQGAAPNAFARDLDAALQRQAKEAANLSREFDKTAAAAEKAANQAARISIRRQEQEAAALARQLQQAERAASQAVNRTNAISLRRQQQETAAFAREFERAADAQRRLQQQQSRDRQTLSGTQFSARETKAIEASIGKVRRETERASKVAALLRQQYGLTDEEVRKVQGSLGGVTQEQGRFNAAIAGFASAGAFIALNAALEAVRGTVQAIVGVFAEASSEFRKFETNLLSFQSKTQGVNVDLEGLESTIKAVATTTSATPASLAETATQLVSLGVAGDEVAGRLESLAQAADVLGENPVILGRVFQGALASYERFGVTAEEVSDTITQAITTTAAGGRAGALEFEQLFSKAAAPAAALGVTIQELTAAFGAFRATGATPQVAASAIETALIRIASKRDELLKEGIELEFKESGALDLEQTLLNIRENIQDLAPTEQLQRLSRLFGESAGSDLLSAINNLDGAYGAATASLQEFAGATQRTFDVVAEGTEFQANIIGGLLATAFTELGEAINPIEKAIISLQQELLSTVEVDLSPLTDAAQRLATVLTGSPERVESLAEVLGILADTAVEQLARVIDAITALVSNDQAIELFIENLASIGTVLETIGGAAAFAIALADGLIQVSVIASELPIIGGAIRGVFERPLNPFQGALAGAFGDIFRLINDVRNAILDFIRTIPVVGETFAALVSPVSTALRIIEERFGPIAERAQKLADNIKAALGFLDEIGSDAGSSLAGGLQVGADALGQFAEVVENARDEINDGEAIGPTFKTPEEGLSATDALKRFKEEQENLLNEIARDDAIAQVDLTAAGADPSEFIDQERKTLEARVKAREDFLKKIRELQNRAGISVAESLRLEKEIAAAEKALADDRLAVQRNFQSERADIIRQASQAQQQALAEIEREAAAISAQIAEENLGPRDAASAAAASEQDSLRERLRNRREFLAELQRIESEGGLTAEQAQDIGNQIIQAETQIYQDRAALAQSLENERQRILQQSLDDQLAALQIFRDREAQALEARKNDLQGQLTVSAAANQVTTTEDTLAQANLELEKEKLETIKAQAEAVGNVSAARQADRDILALNRESLELQEGAVARQFEFKRQQLSLELDIARVEAQRQQLIANIAVKEAEVNVQKAIGSNASIEEIGNLRQILALRQEIANDAGKGIEVTEQVFASREQELDIEEEIAGTKQLVDLENQRQAEIKQSAQNTGEELAQKKDLVAEAEKLAAAEKQRASSLISALKSQQASTAEAQKELRTIRERFREAQRAGLFQGIGAEFESASRQLENILARGGELSELVKFAQNTDSEVAKQLLSGIGRSDVLQLIEADQQFKATGEDVAEAAASAGDPILSAFQKGGQESARLIQAAVGGAVGVPRQSLRVGGVVDGTTGGVAPVQLHRDEFAFAPVGTRVVSQAESRRLVQQHLAATMPGPMAAPTLSIPSMGGAAVQRAFAQNMPTAARLNTRALEKRFDELIDIAARNAATKDGGQTNYFEVRGQDEAARLAAELRRLGRMSRGGVF